MPQQQEGPRKINPKGLADCLDVLTRAAFQSGISWQVTPPHEGWMAMYEQEGRGAKPRPR